MFWIIGVILALFGLAVVLNGGFVLGIILIFVGLAVGGSLKGRAP